MPIPTNENERAEFLRKWYCDNYNVLNKTKLISEESKEEMFFQHRNARIQAGKKQFFIGLFLVALTFICMLMLLLFGSGLMTTHREVYIILTNICFLPACVGIVILVRDKINRKMERFGHFSERSNAVKAIPVEYLEKLYIEYNSAKQQCNAEEGIDMYD